MEYIVIEEKYLSDLLVRVNNKLENGYKCQGGIMSFVVRDGSNYYCQAMIK